LRNNKPNVLTMRSFLFPHDRRFLYCRIGEMRILNRSLDIIFVVYYGVDSTRISQDWSDKTFFF